MLTLASEICSGHRPMHLLLESASGVGFCICISQTRVPYGARRKNKTQNRVGKKRRDSVLVVVVRLPHLTRRAKVTERESKTESMTEDGASMMKRLRDEAVAEDDARSS